MQCELARLQREDYPCCHETPQPDCLVCVCRRRERELLAPNWTDWCGLPADIPLMCLTLMRGVPREKGVWVVFRRGFIGGVHCALQTWEKWGGDICERHPVERVELTDRWPCRLDDDGWYWYGADEDYRERNHHDQDPDDIPDYITGFTGRFTPRAETEGEAVAWLSECLIRWAKSKREGA